MTARWRGGCLALLALLGRQAVAQGEPKPRIQGEEWQLFTDFLVFSVEGDYQELVFSGGSRFRWPRLHIEITGQQGVLLLDRDEAARIMRQPEDGGGLPRRTIDDPPSRRSVSPTVLRERIASFLRAAGRAEPLPETPSTQLGLDLPRHIYFEGGIVVEQDQVMVARCERLWITPLDDRMVLEDVELHYLAAGHGLGPKQTLIARAPRMVKQGPRWTGREVTLTSCTAGNAHVDLLSGEAEIIESDDEFEVWSRGNHLQFSGVSVLPLPDAHFFTGQQGELPIKRVSGGYSASEGARAGVDFGMQWNTTGGALHEFLTGRPAKEFRGSWLLGVDYIEKRGVPLDGKLSYGAKGLYEGTLEGFVLNDHGTDIREITTNIDGTPIDNSERTLLRTQNRVHLGAGTHLDLTAFHARDAAVYSEFFGGDYRDRELPETNVYLAHGSGNVMATVSGRWNLDSFSYADNRSLAPSFVEELPVATVDLFSQPIGSTPWDTPLVLDASFEAGQRRHNFDDHVAGAGDRTSRVDQLVELSAPFPLGPVSVRPYASARGTWYDENAAGNNDGRLAFEAGVRAGTRMQRTFPLTDANGADQSLRHVIVPAVSIADRFHVDGEPADFRQFDATDALDEETRIRFELRNLLQRMAASKEGRSVRDVVMLDLAQNVFPRADRDNAGHELGLLEYELVMRPELGWMPLSNWALHVEGEHDWRDGMRKLDTELQFGKLAGLDWTADYHTDRLVKGAVGLGAFTQLFGRWDVSGGAQYDLETQKFLSYSANLIRRDHDWQIMLSASFNPYTNEVTVNLQFTPHVFGQLRPRQSDWFGMEPLHHGVPVNSY